MKVLALVVLVIAVSGLEAGVVKREVPNIPSMDELTKYMKTMTDVITTNTQEFFAKFHTPELQAQYDGYLEQTKTHMEPVRIQLEKWLNDLKELGSKSS